MENASKALLMAGSILIAILIIAVFIRMYGSVAMFQKTKLTEEEQKEIIAFNEQYTKYLNQYVYGTEVMTVINKTVNYNKENEENNRKITVKLQFKEGYEYSITDKDNDIYNQSFVDLDKNYDIRTKAFKCTKIEYDENIGIVNSISFEEKEWKQSN